MDSACASPFGLRASKLAQHSTSPSLVRWMLKLTSKDKTGTIPYRSEPVKLPCRVTQTPPSFLTEMAWLVPRRTCIIWELTTLQVVNPGKQRQRYVFIHLQKISDRSSYGDQAVVLKYEYSSIRASSVCFDVSPGLSSWLELDKSLAVLGFLAWLIVPAI